MSRRRLDLAWGDTPDPRDPLALDGNTADRILSGSVPPADAPPGYADVVRVLEAAVAPPQPVELAGEVEAVGLITATVRQAPAPPRRTAVLSRMLTARLAAATLASGLTLTTGLAAAGALPDGAQDVVASVLGQVGLDVPSSDADATVDADTDADTGGEVLTPQVDAPTLEVDNDTDADSGDSGDEAKKEKADRPSAADSPPDHPETGGDHGAAVSDRAQSETPDDYENHGAYVCELASRGKCRPEHDQEQNAEVKSCEARSESRAARFEERDKAAQAQAAEDKAGRCEATVEDNGEPDEDEYDEPKAKQAPEQDDPSNEYDDEYDTGDENDEYGDEEAPTVAGAGGRGRK
jgi:hypothetical protein